MSQITRFCQKHNKELPIDEFKPISKKMQWIKKSGEVVNKTYIVRRKNCDECCRKIANSRKYHLRITDNPLLVY